MTAITGHRRDLALYFTFGVCASAACTLLYTHLFPFPPSTIPSPLQVHNTTLPQPPDPLPYPQNDFIPGARDIPTPYGMVRLYEWGPATASRKVLLLHGISGSCVVLLGLADALARAGCRVMLVDLFGRGWSGGPGDLRYDERLYTALIFVCLASSPVSWTGEGSGVHDGDSESEGAGAGAGFTLLGYSLGGGIAADFASWFPDLVQDLVLIAPGGLLKGDWRSRAIYSGLLPGPVMKWVLRRRLGLAGKTTAVSPSARVGNGIGNTGDDDEQKASVGALEPELSSEEAAGAVSGGTSLAERAQGLDLDAIVEWQLDHNPAFVNAFVSSIRFAPTRDQQARWRLIGAYISARKLEARGLESEDDVEGAQRRGFASGNVLAVLGGGDSIIKPDEFVPEAKAALGKENLEVIVYEEAGHGVATSHGAEIAQTLLRRWGMA